MKAIWRKLRSKKAETLVETLVAILLAAMSSLLLAAAVSAASRINHAVRAEDVAFRTELSAAESYSGDEEPGLITVKLESEPDGLPVEVVFYGDSDAGELISYKYTAPEPEGGDDP